MYMSISGPLIKTILLLFPNLYAFCFLLLTVTLARTFSKMLNKSGKKKNSCF